MFLFEVVPSGAGRGLAELSELIDVAKKNSNQELIKKLSYATQASFNKNTFQYVKDLLDIFILNQPIFERNSINFARFISQLENFVENINSIPFESELADIEFLATLSDDKPLLAEVVFLCSFTCEAYSNYLAKAELIDGTEAEDTLEQLTELHFEYFTEPLSQICEIAAEVIIADTELYVDRELNVRATEEVYCKIFEASMYPLMSIFQSIDLAKDTACNDALPDDVVTIKRKFDLPSTANIEEERSNPIYVPPDCVDIFIRDHVEPITEKGQAYLKPFGTALRLHINGLSLEMSNTADRTTTLAFQACKMKDFRQYIPYLRMV